MHLRAVSTQPSRFPRTDSHCGSKETGEPTLSKRIPFSHVSAICRAARVASASESCWRANSTCWKVVIRIRAKGGSAQIQVKLHCPNQWSCHEWSIHTRRADMSWLVSSRFPEKCGKGHGMTKYIHGWWLDTRTLPASSFHILAFVIFVKMRHMNHGKDDITWDNVRMIGLSLNSFELKCVSNPSKLICNVSQATNWAHTVPNSAHQCRKLVGVAVGP